MTKPGRKRPRAIPSAETAAPAVPPVELEVSTEFLQTLIDKAHEFQAKVAVVEPDPGSNPSDEDMREVLEDYGDDPVQQELHEMLADLNIDQLADLVALVWLGRGDFTAAEWKEKRGDAMRLDPKRAPDYLIETPQLADYLEEGLAALGH